MNKNNFLKKLFCSHIWKLTSQDHLFDGASSYNIMLRATLYTAHYASYLKCVKCGKEKVKETTKQVWR